jgi:hypothetical protein
MESYQIPDGMPSSGGYANNSGEGARGSCSDRGNLVLPQDSITARGGTGEGDATVIREPAGILTPTYIHV